MQTRYRQALSGVSSLIVSVFALQAFGDAAQLSVADASVGQGNSATTALTFTITRTGDASYPVTVQYQTASDPQAANPAAAGTDYAATQGTATIPANQTTATVPVSVLQRAGGLPNRQFLFNLSNPAGLAAFQPEQAFAATGLPNGVAVGDLNGDGKLDVVLANNSGGTVAVFLNKTASGNTLSFSPEADFAAGTDNEFSPVIADFDGDGKRDIAVVNGSNNTVAVLLNTTAAGATSPSFAAAETAAVNNCPRGLASADFNGDGKSDLVVTNQCDGTVSVLLNTSTGAGNISFAPEMTVTGGSSPMPVVVADVNGDGKPDLIVGQSGSNTLWVLINTTPRGASTASFSAQQTFSVGEFPDSIVVADFNGDGKPDIAVTDNNDATLYVFENTTTAGASTVSLASPLVLTTGNAPRAVTTGDFDGNGTIDLAVSDNGSTNAVQIYSNTTVTGAGSLAFSSQQPIAVDALGNPVSIATADFNGDGFPDLIIANNTNAADNFGILVNHNDSVTLTSASATGTILATAQAPSFTAITGAALATVVTSNSVTISGIGYAAPVSITGGEYSIGGGAFTSTAGTISDGQTLQLELTSSATANSSSTATVTIGGVPASFVVATGAGTGGGGGGGGGGGAVEPCGLAFLAAGMLLRRRRRSA